MSFALDLSARMAGHATFADILQRLESSGAARSIAAEIETVAEPPSDEDLHKLLYCAGVFVQTDDLAYKRMAQSIALNSIIVAAGDEGAYQRSRRILTDLGSGLVDHSQKMMVAARAMAEKNTVGHRS